MDSYTESRKAQILERFKQLVLAHAPEPGKIQTAIPSLYIARINENHPCVHSITIPMASLVVQGTKLISFGTQEYEARTGQTIVICVDVPSSSMLVNASETNPYLSVHFVLDINILTELLLQTPSEGRERIGASFTRPILDASLEFLETFLRLVDLLKRPYQIPIMAPLLLKELHYLLLIGPQGKLLHNLYMNGAKDNRILEAIAFIRANLTSSLSVEAIARKANMSVSSLHRQFKRITGYTPLQYHKKLKLCEAQRMMLAENERADITALAVGYESVTQFNREYKRMFGEPPHRDILARKKKFDDINGDNQH